MEIEIQEENENTTEEVLTLDDMKGTIFVPKPKVGEETEWMTIKEIKKNKNIQATTKEGKSFTTNLSNVDYKIDVYTDKGIYTVSPWEPWIKLKSALSEFGVIEGVQFMVEHVADGMKDTAARDNKKCYKVSVKHGEEVKEIF